MVLIRWTWRVESELLHFQCELSERTDTVDVAVICPDSLLGQNWTMPVLVPMFTGWGANRRASHRLQPYEPARQIQE